MKIPAPTILTSVAFFFPFFLSNRSDAQEGGTFTYPKGDPGLYRSVETEIKIEPNFRKESSSNGSAYPPLPKEPLIPPPPIPPVTEKTPPSVQKPKPVIPQAKPVPKTYRSQVPRTESVPQTPRYESPPRVPEPERRVELKNTPRIQVPTLPPTSTPPHTYPPQNPYRPENTFPRPPIPANTFPAPSQPFPVPPQAFPAPSENFPALPQKDSPHTSQWEHTAPNVKELREAAHLLSRQGIQYKFGHFTPRFGGLDSSGSVQYLLSEVGIRRVPRTIGGQFDWLKDHRAVILFQQRPTVSDLELSLVPGNLIFWGEFETERLTHVMVYLGHDAKLGKHFAFGSRGGSEVGLHHNEIDVFDLKLNRERIVAIGKIPGLNYR